MLETFAVRRPGRPRGSHGFASPARAGFALIDERTLRQAYSNKNGAIYFRG
jgi:hypothetical protein